jgi:RND family efflux transporter MFP subunit
MKRGIVILFVIIAIAVIGGAGYLGSRTSQPVEAEVIDKPTTISVTRGSVQQTVTAPGQVVGTREMLLSLPVGGQITELHVRRGSQVQAGDRIAALDLTPFEQALEEAQLALAQAEIENTRSLAEAKLNVEIAQIELAQAQTRHPDAVAAETELRTAQADLNELLKPPDEDALTAAVAHLRLAELALQQAQGDYDRVAYADNIGASPEAQRLQEATIEYETRLAEYNLAQRGPTEAELTRAQAQVQQAQANYAQMAVEDQNNAQEVAMLQARLTQAQLAVERLESGVDQALITALEQADQDLKEAVLLAPFDGIVTELAIRPGETVSSGQGFIRLVDPTAIEIQTTVIEEDLPLVQVGQPVEIYFDAEPAEAIAGQVARIVPERVEGESRPLYYVYMAVERAPKTVISGMTADTSIIINRMEDVLRLPRAIVRAGSSDTTQVQVWTGSGTEERAVTVGLRGDTYIEIVDGLNEGEEIVGE